MMHLFSTNTWYTSSGGENVRIPLIPQPGFEFAQTRVSAEICDVIAPGNPGKHPRINDCRTGPPMPAS
jgi:hypothetical protein